MHGVLRQCTRKHTATLVRCTARHGTESQGPCTAQESVGSCVSTVTSGTYTVYQKLFEYSTSRGTSSSSYAGSCQREGGAYEAPAGSSSLAVGAASESHTGCVAADTVDSSNSSFAGFSVQLTTNGKLLGCTNYYGTFSEATVSAVHGVRAPCPNDGTVVGTCDIPQSGVPGPTHTMSVDYGTASAQAPRECAAAGGTYSATYTLP